MVFSDGGKGLYLKTICRTIGHFRIIALKGARAVGEEQNTKMIKAAKNGRYPLVFLGTYELTQKKGSI